MYSSARVAEKSELHLEPWQLLLNTRKGERDNWGVTFSILILSAAKISAAAVKLEWHCDRSGYIHL